jgi:hypothetical protein
VIAMNYIELIENEAVARGYNRIDEFFKYRVLLKKELRTKHIQYDKQAPTAELELLNEVD